MSLNLLRPLSRLHLLFHFHQLLAFVQALLRVEHAGYLANHYRPVAKRCHLVFALRCFIQLCNFLGVHHVDSHLVFCIKEVLCIEIDRRLAGHVFAFMGHLFQVIWAVTFGAIHGFLLGRPSARLVLLNGIFANGSFAFVISSFVYLLRRLFRILLRRATIVIVLLFNYQRRLRVLHPLKLKKPVQLRHRYVISGVHHLEDVYLLNIVVFVL